MPVARGTKEKIIAREYLDAGPARLSCTLTLRQLATDQPGLLELRYNAFTVDKEPWIRTRREQLRKNSPEAHHGQPKIRSAYLCLTLTEEVLTVSNLGGNPQELRPVRTKT